MTSSWWMPFLILLGMATSLGMGGGGEQAPAPKKQGGLLLCLDFTDKPAAAGEGDAARGERRQTLTSISAAGPDHKLRWHAAVPTWAQIPVNPADTGALGDFHDPEENLYHYRTLRLGFLGLSDKVAFSVPGGVFALDRATGALRFEWSHPVADAVGFWFDRGTFEIRKRGLSRCRGDTFGARVFASCEGKLFFFDGQMAAALDENSGRVLAETPWRSDFGAKKSSVSDIRAEIPLQEYAIFLRGVIFVR